jgi:UDP-glucose 4-epimerase
MNIVVTGGAGYIGSAAAEALLAASDKITRELGWQPQFPDLADIVASARDWHRTHPHGYEAAGGD